MDRDIRKSETLDKSFYFNPTYWELAKEKIFYQQPQYLGYAPDFKKNIHNAFPLWMLEHYLDEPILLLKTDSSLAAYSNVCTHRGFTLLQENTTVRKLVCQYHGRQFDLKGQFLRMPEFQDAQDFPRPCDHLTQIPCTTWQSFMFSQLNLKTKVPSWIKALDQYLRFLPWETAQHFPEYDQYYSVKAHWALYIDNYLEGFHVPFVHNTLGAMLDYGKYETHILDHAVLQTGISSDGTPAFTLPEDHIDFGKQVTAYYFWLYPNFMLNVYPWGVQINLVEPKSRAHTRVIFKHYIWDESLWEQMRGFEVAQKTEREDEYVVEAVQRGLHSRYYPGGRFSPTREQGVHYFHQLIAGDLGM